MDEAQVPMTVQQLTSAFAEQRATIDSIKGKVASTTGDLTALRNLVEGLEVSVDQLPYSIEQSLNESLSVIPDRADLNNLNSKVDELKTSMAKLEAALKGSTTTQTMLPKPSVPAAVHNSLLPHNRRQSLKNLGTFMDL